MKLRWRCPTSDRGFTLVEVLVSIFIGAILMSVLYASFFQVIRAKDTAEAELEFYHEARVILSRLRGDLQSAYPEGKVYSDGTAVQSQLPFSFFVGGVERDDNSWVMFTSFSHEPAIDFPDSDTDEPEREEPPLRESDRAGISYYLEPIPDTDLFRLMRKENPRFGEAFFSTIRQNPGLSDDPGVIPYAISERVVKFNISYILQTSTSTRRSTKNRRTNVATTESESLPEWDSLLTNSLPKALEVRLTMRGPRGEDAEFYSLTLIPLANF